MFLIADGWNTIKRNQREVLAYVLMMALLLLCLRALAYWLDLSPENRMPAYSFATDLLQAALFSLIMALVFARIGEDLDRPHWQAGSAGEAVKRFFLPWFLLHLLSFTLSNLAARAGEAEIIALASLLGMLWLLLNVFIIPLGACVMVHGRFRWIELGIALRPLVLRFDLTLIVLSMILFQLLTFLLLLGLQVPPADLPKDNVWIQIKAQVLFLPLINLPINLLDCLVFAMVWRICMIYRDESLEEQDPYDF